MGGAQKRRILKTTMDTMLDSRISAASTAWHSREGGEAAPQAQHRSIADSMPGRGGMDRRGMRESRRWRAGTRGARRAAGEASAPGKAQRSQQFSRGCHPTSRRAQPGCLPKMASPNLALGSIWERYRLKRP